MSPSLLSDLAHLFSAEAYDACSRGDDEEMRRLDAIAAELWEREWDDYAADAADCK